MRFLNVLVFKSEIRVTFSGFLNRITCPNSSLWDVSVVSGFSVVLTFPEETKSYSEKRLISDYDVNNNTFRKLEIMFYS